MKFFDFVPPANKDIDGKEKESSFKGSIKVRIPTYPERLRLIKEMNFKFNEQGKLDAQADLIELSLRFSEIAEKYTENVDLYRMIKGQKLEYKSLEELGYDSEGVPLITEVGKMVINGIQLGES